MKIVRSACVGFIASVALQPAAAFGQEPLLPPVAPPTPATAQTAPAAPTGSAPSGQGNPLTATNPIFAQPPADGSVAPSPAAAAAIGEPPFDWSKFRLGGQYRIEPNANNFGYHPLLISDDQKSSFYVNQRLRLWLTYNPTENVEGYIQMQVGGVNWGSNFDYNKNFGATFATQPDDRVGIQLRRAWLGYKDDDFGKFRAGFLDWHDSFNDTMASSDYDFNIGGVDWTKKFESLNNLKLTAAALMLSDEAFADSNVTRAGSHNAYLFAFDADQPILEKSSIGFSTYYLADHGGYSYPTVGAYQHSYDVWIGARGKTVVPILTSDGLPMDGFVISNFGDRRDNDFTTFHHNGWAAQYEIGPFPVGPGKLSAQVLYSSGSGTPGTGNSSEFRTLAQTNRDNFGSQGYWSYLNVTSPSGPNDTADLGVGLQNRGYGLFTPQARYELPLGQKLISTSTVGWLRSDRPNQLNGSSTMGTEIGQMFTYKFGGGMTLDFGAAVLFTGDFYRELPQAGVTYVVPPSGKKPDFLWENFARLQLEF